MNGMCSDFFTLFFNKGGWSRFSRNAHLIIAHHMQCIVFADSAGSPGLRGRILQPMANAL